MPNKKMNKRNNKMPEDGLVQIDRFFEILTLSPPFVFLLFSQSRNGLASDVQVSYSEVIDTSTETTPRKLR